MFDDLQNGLLHLFIRHLELPDENDSDLLCIVRSVLKIHKRDDETDGLQEGGKTLATVLTNAEPQWLQHFIERFNTVWHSSFRQDCHNSQGSHSLHLLLLVDEPMGDATDEVAQVGKYSTTHHDCDLLDNINTGVEGLPRLFTTANSLEEGRSVGIPAQRR